MAHSLRAAHRPDTGPAAPLAQIAADPGVTESRVSQLLAMARSRVLAEAGVSLD